MLTMLPSLRLTSSKQTVSSNQCLYCYTGLKLSLPKTKLWNVGAGDPPSKILIVSVPVEGVEEFVYLDSKQSSNGYCRPDFLRIGLACSVMNSIQRVWNCSSLGIYTKVHLLQALIIKSSLYSVQEDAKLLKNVTLELIQSLEQGHLGYREPLTCTLKGLFCSNIDPLSNRRQYTGGFPDEVSATDTWYMLVGSCLQCRCFSDLVCQPLVASYVVDAYLCLAMLHAWTLEYRHMMLCVWQWIYLRKQKGNGQLEKTAGSPSQRLAQERFRRMPTLYCYLSCGGLRSPGATERRDASFELRDDDDDDEGWLVSKNGG